MGRGVSSGGGQSSLGYLFGNGEAPKPSTNTQHASNDGQTMNNVPPSKPVSAPQPVDVTKQIPAGINSTSANNYMRADGQNTGNFLTVWFLVIMLFFFCKVQMGYCLDFLSMHGCKFFQLHDVSWNFSRWRNILDLISVKFHLFYWNELELPGWLSCINTNGSSIFSIYST